MDCLKYIEHADCILPPPIACLAKAFINLHKPPRAKSRTNRTASSCSGAYLAVLHRRVCARQGAYFASGAPRLKLLSSRQYS